jgi:60 kDa SS-A/Ro ribonucleoprotein
LPPLFCSLLFSSTNAKPSAIPVNIDLQPYQTVKAYERADIMNIGDFSKAVFNGISEFLAYNNQRFVAEVEAIEL